MAQSVTTLGDTFARLTAKAATDPAFAKRVRNDLAAATRELTGRNVPGDAARIEGYAVYEAGSFSGPYSSEELARALEQNILGPGCEIFDPSAAAWIPAARFVAGDTTTATPPTPPQTVEPQVIVYRNERESITLTPDAAREAVKRAELRRDDWAWDASRSDWVPLHTLVSGLDPAAPAVHDTELARLREDNAILNQKVESLERHLAQALKGCAAADRMRDELRERDADLAAARSAATNAAAAAARLERELGEWRNRAEAAEHNAARCLAEVERLTVELGVLRPEQESLRTRAETLERDLRERTAACEELRRENAHLRGVLGEIGAALARAQPVKPAPPPRPISRT